MKFRSDSPLTGRREQERSRRSISLRRIDNIVDFLHGIVGHDSYHWLEEVTDTGSFVFWSLGLEV